MQAVAHANLQVLLHSLAVEHCIIADAVKGLT